MTIIVRNFGIYFDHLEIVWKYASRRESSSAGSDPKLVRPAQIFDSFIATKPCLPQCHNFVSAFIATSIYKRGLAVFII